MVSACGTEAARGPAAVAFAFFVLAVRSYRPRVPATTLAAFLGCTASRMESLVGCMRMLQHSKAPDTVGRLSCKKKYNESMQGKFADTIIAKQKSQRR